MDFSELLDEQIDAAATVVSAELDSSLVASLVNDVACRIHDYPTIAKRYGLTEEALFAFIQIPEVRRRCKVRRAVWESDDNLGERNRVYYGNITLEAAPILDRLIQDVTTPPAVKMDAYKIAGKFAGLEVVPKVNQDQTPTASQFNVTFVFGSSGQVQKISTTPPTIEADIT